MTAFADLKARAAKAGRDMKTISVSVFGMATADEAKLDAYREAGFARVLLRLPPEGREVVLPLIDQWAKLIH
jgi:alkanesulfonate monooxygenase SsuD/methylene tetrahydromethanopterin reductase-like flavin-dependent oxidoreductase (luciferase family)